MYKKLIFIFITGCMLLSGCGTNGVEEAEPVSKEVAETQTTEAPASMEKQVVETPVPTEIPTTATPTPTAEVPDYMALYKPTVTRLVALMQDENAELDADEDGYGVWEAAMALGEEAAEKIGYLLKDISGDAIPELVIGCFDVSEYAFVNNEIYAVYTLENNKPRFLLGGRSRSSYALTEDGGFYHHGSSGAAYIVFGKYHIVGTSLICADFYFTYPDENDPGTVYFYHNTTGEFAPEKAEKLSISDEAFWEIEEVLSAETAKLAAEPLSAFSAVG